RAFGARIVDAVLCRRRTLGAVARSSSEARHQGGAVGRVEDGGGVLRNLRRRGVRGTAADVEAAGAEGEELRPHRGGASLAREGWMGGGIEPGGVERGLCQRKRGAILVANSSSERFTASCGIRSACMRAMK